MGVSFFTIAWSFIFIMGFILLKELRQKPGDIILVIAISTFFLGIKSAAESINLLRSDSNEIQGNDIKCQLLGFFHTIFINLSSLYQLAFYIYQACALQKTLYGTSISRKYYHMLTISSALILTVVEFGMGAVGMNIIGTCSAQTTVWILLPTITYGAYFIALLYTGYYIQKYLSQRSRDLNQREFTYVQHYLGYMVLLCVIIVSLAAVDVDNVLRLNKYIGTPDLENNADIFDNLALTKFILVNLSPFFLVVARIRDPAILKPFMDGFKYVVCCYWARNSTDEAPLRDSHLLVSPFEREGNEIIKSPLLRKPRLSHLKGTKRRSQSYEPVPTENTNSKQRNKDPQMFYSIFAGIHYFWYLQKTEAKENKGGEKGTPGIVKDDLKDYKEKAKEKKKFSLHNALLKQNLPNIYREIKNRKYKVRFGIFTSYASSLFMELIEADGISQDLMSSLELVRNFSNIINAESMSKKFQFITYNSKFIIRSISKGERRVLLDILPAYLNHLRTQPYSLLPRIYGLFRFEVLGPYHQVNWLIMKNISEKSGTNIERMYDVKGSGTERVVPRTEGIEVRLEDLKGYGLLRDGDFEDYEGSIYINNNMKGSLHDAIKQDVNFLTRENLMNYSLMVTIANGTRPNYLQQRLSSSVIIEVEESLEERSMTIGHRSRMGDDDDRMNLSSMSGGSRTNRLVSNVSNVQIQNPFCNIKSTKENVFYSLEIDNFLLKYDWKRKIIALCRGSDGENGILKPDVYGGRFRQYVKKMTLDRGDLIPSVQYEEEEHEEEEEKQQE